MLHYLLYYFLLFIILLLLIILLYATVTNIEESNCNSEAVEGLDEGGLRFMQERGRKNIIKHPAT